MTTKLTVNDLRPSVVAFAIEMERELRANARKGNRAAWRREFPADLIAHLSEELDELDTAAWELRRPGMRLDAIPARLAAVRSEAADVGNMAMMVADACGALDVPEGAE